MVVSIGLKILYSFLHREYWMRAFKRTSGYQKSGPQTAFHSFSRVTRSSHFNKWLLGKLVSTMQKNEI
jgi:hypothetical protein